MIANNSTWHWLDSASRPVRPDYVIPTGSFSIESRLFLGVDKGGKVIEVQVQLLNADSKLPTFATVGAAGMDLHATLSTTIEPGKFVRVSTGLAMEVPIGWEGQIRPRSGLAASYGVTVLNTPGTIDADFRGEIEVILINHGPDPFLITPGMRIAQMVIARVERPVIREAASLQDTERGPAGFGSTGS